MEERKWPDDTGKEEVKLTDHPSTQRVREALENVENRLVALHKEGAIVRGADGKFYVVSEGGRWRLVPNIIARTLREAGAKMAEPRWIRFVENSWPGRKTSTWDVLSKEDGCLLGEVSWYGAWRKYVFEPRAGARLVFEEVCLRDIAAFVEARTRDHREAKKAGG